MIDTLVKPIYEDVVLAWMSPKITARAQNSGWDRLEEYFQQGTNGVNKAYTITSMMVLRAAMWSTKTVVSWEVTVADGIPYLIGDRGLGHYFLDDRIGLSLKGDDIIHMDRARKLDLAWNEEDGPTWQITVGDDRIWQDPAQKAWGKIERLVAGLKDQGLW